MKCWLMNMYKQFRHGILGITEPSLCTPWWSLFPARMKGVSSTPGVIAKIIPRMVSVV